MFATLGTIQFETLTSPTALQFSREYDYAEHKVVEAPPVLQWISDGLRTVELNIRFRAEFSDPAAQLQALAAAADAHAPLALVFGNGFNAGNFVIVKIANTAEVSLADGTLMAAEVKLSLKQVIQPSVPLVTPLAAVAAAPGASTSVATSTAVPFTATPLPVSGVSALLGVSPPNGNPLPGGSFEDVPTSSIVRTQ